MKLLQQKLATYTEPQKAKAAGIYPYFRAISSEQDTEVIINGKKVLMFGSNCYSGLVNHPKVREAAIEAVRAVGLNQIAEVRPEWFEDPAVREMFFRRLEAVKSER